MTRESAKVVVLKIGGSTIADLSAGWWDGFAEVARERPVICVHGWSRPLERYRAKRNRASTMLRDKHGHRSRLTDLSVVDDIVTVSKSLRLAICQNLQQRGLAVGTTVAATDGLLEARVRPNLWWIGGELTSFTNLVGPLVGVDVAGILERLDCCDVLVLTPLAVSAQCPLVNVDGDRAAARIASALKVQALMLTTDVAGVRFRKKTLSWVDRSQLHVLMEEASGGMSKKLRAVDEALAGGVERVGIGNAPPPELLSGCKGTQVVSR